MSTFTDGFRKVATPDLARVIAAAALLLAVMGGVAFAFRHHADTTKKVPRVVEGDQEVRYVDGDRRIVRRVVVGKVGVVCSEGPRQMQMVSDVRGTKPEASRTPTAILSTVYLREAGWQICSAYANGAIDAGTYKDLLTRLLAREAVPPARWRRRASRPRAPIRR